MHAFTQELCDSRFASMRAEEAKQRAREAKAAAQGQETGGVAAWAQGLSDFGASLQEFHKSYGLMQTALVALLSSSAAAQRFLQSGRACEFRRSVELAEQKGAAIVLGAFWVIAVLGSVVWGLWGKRLGDAFTYTHWISKQTNPSTHKKQTNKPQTHQATRTCR